MCKVLGRLSRSGVVALVCVSVWSCCPYDPFGLLHSDEPLPTGTNGVTEAQCDELGDQCFRMSVIGDSIAWGNGLEEDARIWSRMATAIETETAESETPRQVYRQVYAYTGAELGKDVDCCEECLSNPTGEVPEHRPTIFEQVGCVKQLNKQDFILVSGCINDVKVATIINPSTDSEKLAALTDEFCLDEMRNLLQRLSDEAPDARVIVMGYYPVFSEESAPTSQNLAALFSVFGVAVGTDIPPFSEKFVSLSRAFAEQSLMNIQTAVDDANLDLDGGDMFAVADPEFQPENSVFASQSWLFGFDSSWNPGGFLPFQLPTGPIDPLRDIRVTECICVSGESAQKFIPCVLASVSHPSPLGEDAYFNAVWEQWQALNEPSDAPDGM